MYNRYTPQNDGSFRKCQVRDSTPPPPPKTPCPPPKPRDPIQPEVLPPQPPKQECPCSGSYSLLRALLPENFQTADLLVVLLLLLMAGESQEQQGTALLTLALYLFQ